MSGALVSPWQTLYIGRGWGGGSWLLVRLLAPTEVRQVMRTAAASPLSTASEGGPIWLRMRLPKA